MVDDMSFSPFDAPVKETNTNKTTDGIKIEQITDAELGGRPGGDVPKPKDNPNDVPEFKIPNFDDVPFSDLGGQGGGGNPFSEQPSGMGGGGGGGQSTSSAQIPDGFAKEFSEYTAKWLVDIFFRLLITGVKQYAKIDKSEILNAVNKGLIDSRFLKFVDEANDNVDKNVKVTDDEKAFVIEPLKYFIQVKKVELKPEWMFVTSLLMVSGNVVLQAIDLKKQNKQLIDQIISESQKIREDMSSGVSGARAKASSTKTKKEEAPQDVEYFTSSKMDTFEIMDDFKKNKEDEIYTPDNVEEVPGDN